VRRKNEKGEEFFREFLARNGEEEDTINMLWDSRQQRTQRNVRRHLTYFVECCEADGIEAAAISDYKTMETQRIRVMKRLASPDSGQTRSAEVIAEVLGAVSMTVAYVWDKRLVESHAVKGVMRCIQMRCRAVEQPLVLSWDWSQVTEYWGGQKPPEELSWDELLQKTIGLLRGLTALRATEIDQMNRKATRPDADGSSWTFELLIKGHPKKTRVTVLGNTDVLMDPVRHLVELDRRIDASGSEDTSFWIRQDGKRVSYAALGAMTATMMKAAGINDSRPYHMKHGAATAMVAAGKRPEEITEWMRHKHGSTVYLMHYADLNKGQTCAQALASVRPTAVKQSKGRKE
jgi:hypothetical protein